MDLLDTDILIDVQRGHGPALAWFSQLAELPYLPGYVVMELIQDARNRPGSGKCAQACRSFSRCLAYYNRLRSGSK
jgi:hypothetical protein